MAVGTDYKQLVSTSSKSTKLLRGTNLLKRELELLLGFERYTLFFGNNMGLDARRFLHLGNNRATYNLVKSEIEKLLKKYGRVTLQSLVMTFDDSARTLTIDMALTPKNRNRSAFTTSITLGE